MIDAGLVPNKEASMQKFYGTELQQRMANILLDIEGLYGTLDWRDPASPIAGAVEKLYRRSPVGRFGGGTNEVQRNIVAQRGLGLPRA